MKDEETISRALVTQIDAGDRHAARKNIIYMRLSQRLEQLRLDYVAGRRTRSQFLKACTYRLFQLRVPRMDQDFAVVDEPAANAAAVDVDDIIPWAELDNLLGLDAPLWQPWT